MTERLSTSSATAESTVFTPGADFYVQVSAVDSGATFDVMARVDANADWVVLDTLDRVRPIGYFANLPFVKIRVKDNGDLTIAKAWSSP